MRKLIAFLVTGGIVIGAGLGIACLLAWAVTSIWPSLPFWPIAIIAWVLAVFIS